MDIVLEARDLFFRLDGREIFQGLDSPKEIHVIEGADHRLTQPVHRQRAMDLTAEWLKKFL